MALKASRACSQEPPELRAKEISLQEGAHRVQHVTKAATPYKMGQIYLLVFKGPLGRGGAAVALWGHLSWWQMQLGPMLTPVSSRHFSHLWLRDLAPPDSLQAPMLGLTGQTTHRAETEPHTTFRHIPAH